MDAKITKKRLSEFLSYEWIKIAAIALAIILFWSLLFSVSGTKLTPDQLFTVINYTGTKTGDDFSTYTSRLVPDGVFSYEVNEVSVTDLTVENGTMSGTLLDSRLSTGEGDVLFAADVLNKKGKRVQLDAQDNPVVGADGKYVEVESTYLYDFLISRYNQCVMPVEDVIINEGLPSERTVKGVVTVVDEYLGRFFDKNGGKYDETSLDKEAAERDFRARVAATKDKRFRNEQLLAEGVKKEETRLVRYCEAFNAFNQYLQDGVIQTTQSTLAFPTDDGDYFIVKGNYSLNLCPTTGAYAGKMSDVQKAVFYYEEVPEDYKEEPPRTADDLNLVFLHLQGSKEEYVCERILFVDYLVKKYVKDYAGV